MGQAAGLLGFIQKFSSNQAQGQKKRQMPIPFNFLPQMSPFAVLSKKAFTLYPFP